MILNETPVRTSKNFKINNIELKDLNISQKLKKFNGLSVYGDISDFIISEDVENIQLTYGLGKELEKQVYESANKKIKIITNSINKRRFINFDFNLDEENMQLVENIELTAKPNSKTTITIKYMSDGRNEYYHNGILKINAMENSQIDVIIVNMLNSISSNFLSMENTLEESSNVNYCIVDFGGRTSISNYYSNLIGNNAKSNLNTIYLGTESQIFDINYIAELRGERTDANIEVQGALKDNAKKNFKGTIDFKKGSKKAKGNENEFCMLLSDTAKSKALPMLLCTEEDVEGNHSSAAGKIEKDMLFYIMCRGFSYKEAMKLIVKAKFNEILGNIKDEELKEEILNNIDERLD